MTNRTIAQAAGVKFQTMSDPNGTYYWNGSEYVNADGYTITTNAAGQWVIIAPCQYRVTEVTLLLLVVCCVAAWLWRKRKRSKSCLV